MKIDDSSPNLVITIIVIHNHCLDIVIDNNYFMSRWLLKAQLRHVEFG